MDRVIPFKWRRIAVPDLRGNAALPYLLICLITRDCNKKIRCAESINT
jgi:hypothetical protein